VSNPELYKLLAEEAAKVAVMTPEERSAYYDQIKAGQLAYMKANPYTEGERQARAMRPAPTLAEALELPEIKALVGTATKTLAMVEDLVAESGRAIKYDAEDAFRMGEWFDDADMQDITKAHAALAALQTKGDA